MAAPRPLSNTYLVDATDPAPHEAIRAAAERRAAALAARDEPALRALLHPAFGWTSHTGAHFDRERYIRSNVDSAAIDGTTNDGAIVWHGQHLDDVTVTIVGDAAVLHCIVADDVTIDGRRRVHRMPMTQTWVRAGAQAGEQTGEQAGERAGEQTGEGWQLLAGHAGPRLGETLLTR